MSEDNLVIKDGETVTQYSLDNLINKIIQGNSLEILPKIPDESVDLVFIDPPYFLQLPKKKLVRWNVKSEVDGVDDEWDDFDSFKHYDSFIQTLLTEIKRIMKPNATLWIISTYHSIFRIGKLIQDLDYWLLGNVIWLKSNPMPNWLGVRFTNATETMIWAVKQKDVKDYTFHVDQAKKFGIGKVGANVWVIPLCAGKERLKNKEGEKLHSTQKPVELLKRIIKITSNEGDIILDPLAGTGTTGHVAKYLNRNFILIEQDEEYISGIVKRLKTPPKFKKRESKIQTEIEEKMKKK